MDSRAFTGAWIETSLDERMWTIKVVAPSRARGLKQVYSARSRSAVEVAPSRARGLKLLIHLITNDSLRRAFTGAWIETDLTGIKERILTVAPSRARGLKLKESWKIMKRTLSRLHGRVD